MKVTLVWSDGRREATSVDRDETILEGVEAAGVALPYGCRTGACSTCTGRLVTGTVEHRRQPRALKDRHRADGYVLLCIAEPRSDCRIAVGEEVQRGLVTNPWR